MARPTAKVAAGRRETTSINLFSFEYLLKEASEAQRPLRFTSRRKRADVRRSCDAPPCRRLYAEMPTSSRPSRTLLALRASVTVPGGNDHSFSPGLRDCLMSMSGFFSNSMLSMMTASSQLPVLVDRPASNGA